MRRLSVVLLVALTLAGCSKMMSPTKGIIDAYMKAAIAADAAALASIGEVTDRVVRGRNPLTYKILTETESILYDRPESYLTRDAKVNITYGSSGGGTSETVVLFHFEKVGETWKLLSIY